MRKAGLQIKEITSAYKEVLEGLGIKVEDMILYGSFARGSQREGSDIDLVIVSRNFKRMNLRQRLEILGIAAARIMRPVEAKGYTPQEIKNAQEESFLGEVLKTGTCVL